MKHLEYPLFAEGFVNRFLISEVHTQVREFTRSTLSGRVNEWLKKGFAIHENPCRKEFLEERRREVPDYPDFTKLSEDNKLKQYFPFGNPGIDASGFYYRPTYLRMYGFTTLWSDVANTIDFELETCGGLTVWANEQLICDFTPFTRNLVKKTTVSIPLLKGENSLVVCLDDLAERDTDYYFRIKRLGGADLKILIPVKEEVNEGVLTKMEQMLNAMSFDKEAYISESIKMNLINPFETNLDLEVIITPGEFIEKMEQSWKLIKTRKYTMEPYQKGLELFHTDDISPGYYYFTVVLTYQGIAIKRNRESAGAGRIPLKRK
ncbi:hypothetical protein [Lacrimispora xylanisolvens]|uniref:hypothetical protein n=1 Tax=Lacrimispora xylanisolvens TaxID=384636 RepID=UPI00240274CD